MPPFNFRMPEINHVTISGRVVGDVADKEVGTTLLSTFTLVSNRYQKKDKEKATWLKVKCWGRLAEWATRQLSDRMPVIVEGVLDTESWESEGKKVQITTIIATRVSLMAWPANDGSTQREPDEIVDEEIPF